MASFTIEYYYKNTAYVYAFTNGKELKSFLRLIPKDADYAFLRYPDGSKQDVMGELF